MRYIQSFLDLGIVEKANCRILHSIQYIIGIPGGHIIGIGTTPMQQACSGSTEYAIHDTTLIGHGESMKGCRFRVVGGAGIINVLLTMVPFGMKGVASDGINHTVPPSVVNHHGPLNGHIRPTISNGDSFQVQEPFGIVTVEALLILLKNVMTHGGHVVSRVGFSHQKQSLGALFGKDGHEILEKAVKEATHVGFIVRHRVGGSMRKPHGHGLFHVQHRGPFRPGIFVGLVGVVDFGGRRKVSRRMEGTGHGAIFKKESSVKGAASRASIEPHHQGIRVGGRVGLEQPKHVISPRFLARADVVVPVLNGQRTRVHGSVKRGKGRFQLFETLHQKVVPRWNSIDSLVNVLILLVNISSTVVGNGSQNDNPVGHDHPHNGHDEAPASHSVVVHSAWFQCLSSFDFWKMCCDGSSRPRPRRQLS
mmetsp:Transcript_7164/g.20013  ORF Transcript_7164/g.20013 Transcript_7164/m.20013 type:complete len:421 (-) Transcript_7164:208-1470(-)